MAAPQGCEPDLIAVHGRIYTVDPAVPWVEALAVCGERIVRTGTTRDIEALAGPGRGGSNWLDVPSFPASTTATYT
jgi:hypothetical protein